MKDSKNVSKVLIKKGKKYLIMVRSDNGRFDLPGGHCHEGESFYIGAVREVWEETRLVCLDLKEIFSSSKKKVFLCESIGGEEIVLDTKENSECIWMTKKEILELNHKESTDVIFIAKSFFMKKK